MAKIGYIPIRYYNTNKLKVCETPRHKGLKFAAFGVMALTYDHEGIEQTVVQMVCEECWNHFDLEMGSPEWDLSKGQNENRNEGS